LTKLEDATDDVKEVPYPACDSCTVSLEIASIPCPENPLGLRQKGLRELRQSSTFINPNYILLVKLNADHDANKKSAIGYDLTGRRDWRV
jgi:hypothetical protein